MPPPDVPVASMPAVPAPVASALPRGPVAVALDKGKALVDRVEATSGAVVRGTRRSGLATAGTPWPRPAEAAVRLYSADAARRSFPISSARPCAASMASKSAAGSAGANR